MEHQKLTLTRLRLSRVTAAYPAKDVGGAAEQRTLTTTAECGSRRQAQKTNPMRPILLAIALGFRLSYAAAPEVTKVEPPDWAAEPKGITLRMLVTGRNLAGPTVRSTFRTGPVKVSQSGTHLFVDLSIPKSAAPGSYPLDIATPDRKSVV